MTQDLRNTFISHIHENDSGVTDLKDLLSRHGLTCRDESITRDKFNAAQNEEYIKYGILAPRINWSGVFLVYISPETRRSAWVDWEIEYAHKQGKRIVGVWERGSNQCEPPQALELYADAVVGWHGESVLDAINGHSDVWHQPDGSTRQYRNITRYSC